jgi:hypothetical protein
MELLMPLKKEGDSVESLGYDVQHRCVVGCQTEVV